MDGGGHAFMAEGTSIFDKIVGLEAEVEFMGRPLPPWKPTVEECVRWLSNKGLTRDGRSLQPDNTRDPAGLLNPQNPWVLGVPTKRAERKTKSDLDRLRKEYKTEGRQPRTSTADLARLWSELRSPESSLRQLELARLPPDALAFYRSFHFSPPGEWGIYILVGPLMRHCACLYESFSGKLAAFNPETLLGCVLFEVFHHEFFHHLTECAATTLEIASAGLCDEPIPIYANYQDCLFTRQRGLGEHPDHPLEEALANAYAYNSFSFLSRTEIGARVVWVKVYQAILEKCWAQDPAGYKSAAQYIKGKYVSGGAQLLAMLLSSRKPDPASLMLLAKTVMPSGNSAFEQKPNIPTYLVGDAHTLARFAELVPAPNETYTSLLWLGDTAPIDQYLKDRKEKEAAAKKKVP